MTHQPPSGPPNPLGPLARWRPASTRGRVGLGLAALLAAGGIASLGGDPATDKTSTPSQGIADPALVAATEASDATTTPRPPATPRPTDPPATATDAPPPTATPLPPTLPPPTAIPPTAPPTAVPLPPTAAPPPGPVNPRPDVDPGGDRDCKDFASRTEAQSWWNFWHAQGHPNPGRLDGNDNDGQVCESW